MTLNDRQTKILEAIINDYIATAEPVGSRTIARKYDLGISSATIRNEMSDLEEMGLIIQPHTSSGRIPSDKGYRLYVDSLMRPREPNENELAFLREVISSNIRQIDYLMKETARAISLFTNYTTIISEPGAGLSRIKHIQLIPYDEKHIITVLVTDSKAVKNIRVRIGESLGMDVLNAISLQLNAALAGTVGSDLRITKPILDMFPGNEGVIASVLSAVINDFAEDEEIYTSGANYILAFPEFANIERAKEIFKALEEKRILCDLMRAGGDDDIEIVIGDENAVAQMKNCSVIKANFRMGKSRAGGVGIIGPTRMDYAQVASILGGIVKKINAALKALSDGG